MAQLKKEERAFKISGIVEAFFGRMWSMDDRKSLVARFVPKGLNHYLYAAKEDPKVVARASYLFYISYFVRFDY
jgi:hypothetical protein